MTTDTVLSSDQRDKFVGDLIEYGTDFVAPLYAVVESIEQAVLQSPEVQGLRSLLAEARRQLPLAAACWNEDENRDVAETNAKHVLDLIARIDVAMEEKP